MVFFQFNGKKCYIDKRLKRELDGKIIPDLKKKDKDVVFGIDGKERIGKSVFAMGLGAYISSILETEFNSSNICMTPLEFRQKIEKSKKNQVVIYDEAHRGMASSRTLSEVNKILKDLMMEMGQKNLFVLIVLPTFFLLDKYVALFRTTGLFHIYENKRRRGFWVFYNEKRKQTLYMRGKKEFNYNCMKFPRFRGRFFDQYPIDETEYREKKRKSFKSKPRLTKAEVLIEQRDILIWIIHEKYDLDTKEIEKIMKKHKNALSLRRIQEIIAKMRARQEKKRERGT
jgi:hypothetical protein